MIFVLELLCNTQSNLHNNIITFVLDASFLPFFHISLLNSLKGMYLNGKSNKKQKNLIALPHVILDIPGEHNFLNKNLTLLIKLVLRYDLKNFLQIFYTFSYKDNTEFDIEKVPFDFCFSVVSHSAYWAF